MLVQVMGDSLGRCAGEPVEWVLAAGAMPGAANPGPVGVVDKAGCGGYCKDKMFGGLRILKAAVRLLKSDVSWFGRRLPRFAAVSIPSR